MIKEEFTAYLDQLTEHLRAVAKSKVVENLSGPEAVELVAQMFENSTKKLKEMK